jgi:hypothetical protein
MAKHALAQVAQKGSSDSGIEIIAPEANDSNDHDADGKQAEDNNQHLFILGGDGIVYEVLKTEGHTAGEAHLKQ